MGRAGENREDRPCTFASLNYGDAISDMCVVDLKMTSSMCVVDLKMTSSMPTERSYKKSIQARGHPSVESRRLPQDAPSILTRTSPVFLVRMVRTFLLFAPVPFENMCARVSVCVCVCVCVCRPITDSLSMPLIGITCVSTIMPSALPP